MTRSELRVAEGARPEVPRDRCPTDGTVLSLTEPLPPGPARRKEPLSPTESPPPGPAPLIKHVSPLDVAAALVFAAPLLLLMAGAFAPWVAIVIVGVAFGLTSLTGHGLFAVVGIAVAVLMLAGGWVLRHYEA